MKRVVLDANALISFYEGRPGAAVVQDLLEHAAKAKVHLLMSVVNWGELYYSIWRGKGPGIARKIAAEIAQLPIQLVDADLELTQSAAELHAQNKLPYADCFAAALASQRGAEVATGDSDFAKLPRTIRILWTR